MAVGREGEGEWISQYFEELGLGAPSAQCHVDVWDETSFAVEVTTWVQRRRD